MRMRTQLMAVVFTAGAAVGVLAGRVSSGAQPRDVLPSDVYADSRSRLPLVTREALDEFGARLYDEIAKDSRRVTGFQGPGGLRMHSPRVGAMVPSTRIFGSRARSARVPLSSRFS